MPADVVRSEVEDIKTKLQHNHHVVVTAHQGGRSLETSLAAINDLSYYHERCVEMNKASEWTHIDPHDVDLVLYKCTLGLSDSRKAEEMNKVLKKMYWAAKPSNGKKHIDIVVLFDENALKRFTSMYKLEILAKVVRVSDSPTSEKTPVDLTCSKF